MTGWSCAKCDGVAVVAHSRHCALYDPDEQWVQVDLSQVHRIRRRPDAPEEEDMPNGDVETYYEADTWHSRIQGQNEPFASGGTKADQVAKGRAEAQSRKVEHIIKNENGQIAERNSYGHDPRNTPG